MRNNVKYKDMRIGQHVFTIKLRAFYDCDLGSGVHYDIYEWHIPARTIFGRFLQWWKLEYYDNGNWYPTLDNDTLEQRLICKCDKAVISINKENDFQKQWENI